MINSFVNRYQLQKTLQFSLIPVGNTEAAFLKNKVLEEDEQRTLNAGKVKGYMDEYHRQFIEQVLSGLSLSGLESYANLYFMNNRSQSDNDQMDQLEQEMRVHVADAFEKQLINLIPSKKNAKSAKTNEGKNTGEKRKRDYLTSEKLITIILPNSTELAENEKEIVASFDKFTTYFQGFDENRNNMYSDEAKATSIANRCINENLPKYLDNIRAFNRISDALPNAVTKESREFTERSGFSCVLPQTGIDRYNEWIGSINSKVNSYNQQTVKSDKSKRLPLLKPLFKQILSDRDSFSFIPEEFQTDSELLSAIYSFYTENSEDRSCLAETIIEIRKLFSELVDYQQEGIFVSAGLPITNLSKAITGSWDTISSVWYDEYTVSNPIGRRNAEKYEDDKRKAYKQVKSFSLSEIERLLHTREEYREKSVSEYYSSAVTKSAEEISQKYADAQKLLSMKCPSSKKLCNDADAVEKIKNLLDSIKGLEHLIQPLNGTGKEEQRDSGFYGLFDKLFRSLAAVDRLYDQVRNYLTKKPYSQDKIKLNFSASNLLNGWTDTHTDLSDGGTQYGGYLFRKKNTIGEYDYYLGISKNAKLFRSFVSVNADDQSEYERLDYYQAKSNTIYGSSYKGENGYPADRVALLDTIRSCVFLANNPSVASAMTKYLNKKPNEVTPLGCIRAILSVCPTFTDTLLKFPEFCRQNELVIRNLQDTMQALAGRLQGADLIASKNYSLFSEIMADIEIIQNSKFYTYFHVSEKEMQQALNADKKTLYLFKISNQDLSYAENHAAGKRQSRGRENLHTMYFKALMSGSQTVLDIGSGEMYFRKASIPEDDRIIHPANVPVQNKNPKNAKQQSVFPYDLIKDRRYTRNQFSLHLSVTINYQAQDNSPSTDTDVKCAVRSAVNPHIIGIDRGERNLLYICVIDGSGNIVLQKSLNEIVSDNGHEVDYHALLDDREKARDLARKSWNTIENIKELKEGYMSQVIHEICELVVKYDAVIALENLNGGFKNSRAKVEKQVYQKFETMLTTKLNYLADKKLDPDTPGGLLNAYQLTNKAGKKHNNEFQDGILFYVPAWLTSKIDPTTGFVNLFQTKYTTISAAREFFSLFDDISYNEADGWFEFAADYAKFPRGSVDYRQKWTVCTNGERIENGGKKNQYATRTVVLTDEFRRLFEQYGIEVSRDLQEQIAAQSDSDFYRRLTSLFALTVQMRNSIPNSDVDYLISPVRNSEGRFFDSRTVEGNSLPENADANGAYNIARKCLWAIRVLQETDEAHLDKVKLAITNQEWLKFAQENEHHE